MDVRLIFVLALVLLLNASNGLDTLKKLVPSCRTKIDLAIVIDTSRSISPDDFKLQMQFVYDIVNFLDVGMDDTRVAAVSYSNHLFPEFGFSDFTTKKEVLQAIKNIKHSNGDATRTYLALEHVHRVIFAPGNGERPDVVDVVVVLTDGETNPGSYDKHWGESGKAQTQIEAAVIKDRPAYIFAIGVGSAVDVNELNGISSDPDSRFTILVSSFKKLNSEDVKKMLLARACVIQTTPAPPITTPAQKTEECKVTVADIFFVLDESSSIKTATNFQKELNFVASVIDYLEIGPTKTQVGIMTFSDQPKMKFHLNEFTTKTEIVQAITSISWHGGNTFLDRALRMLRNEGLNPAFGSRSDVPQIAVVVTDGVSTDPSKTKEELKKLQQLNYILFAVGVGPARSTPELNLIAKNPENVFEVESLDGLEKIRKELATRVCTASISASLEMKKP